MEGDSRLIPQQPCVPFRDQEDLHEQNRHRECLNIVLLRTKSESLPTESNASDPRFVQQFRFTSVVEFLGLQFFLVSRLFQVRTTGDMKRVCVAAAVLVATTDEGSPLNYQLMLGHQRAKYMKVCNGISEESVCSGDIETNDFTIRAIHARNLIGKLSVSQFANPTQNEFAANDRNFSVASTCELRFGSSNVPSLSCFDLREEGCCLFLNMSTFHAHFSVSVPLCQSAPMYTTIHCPLAQTNLCVAQAL